MRSCSVCGIWKQDCAFYQYALRNGKPHKSAECKDCKRLRMRENYYERVGKPEPRYMERAA